MLVIRIELHSARTGKTTEIGRMVMCNTGAGTETHGDYHAVTGRRGETDNTVIASRPVRRGTVEGHPRLAKPVWTLVRKMLTSMGY